MQATEDRKRGIEHHPGALTPGHLVGAELPAPHWEKRGGAGLGKDRKQNGYVTLWLHYV